jgi:Fe-S oxidoreductase
LYQPFGSLEYVLLYVTAVATVIALLASLFLQVRKKNVKLKFDSLLQLGREEVARLFRKDAVFIMHGSIIAGIIVTIGLTLFDPFEASLYIIRYILLALTVPVFAGLLAALVWRVFRLTASTRVHKMLGSGGRFRRSSIVLQSILIVIIALTMLQAFLEWFPGFRLETTSLDAFKNVLIAVFYAGPAVNLLKNFQRPRSDITTPFLLKDVLEGRMDPSQVRMGVTSISQFQDYETTSIDSCVEIGACEAACPATAVDRPLSPRVLVRKLKLLKSDHENESQVFDTINEQELWSCTTCGACVESCPVGVRHVDMIIDMRRSLVAENRLDKKKSDLLASLNQVRNSLGIPNAGRNSWLSEMGLKTVDENRSFEYLVWVGCMSSFDEGSKGSIKALLVLLGQAGILDRFAMLGEQETCCGDPARRLGEESLFQEMALGNIELFKKYGVKKIVLTCPHGCNTFSKEYPNLDPWMKEVKVYHQVQLLEELAAGGKLALEDSGEKLTIHDPCYLSRYGGVVDTQRKLLGRISDVVESHPHGEKTFCCGAGGANYWYEVPERKRISHVRMEQLNDSGAETVVTMCPFCNAMLKDASRSKNLDENRIKDVSEVMIESTKTSHETKDVN